jgi:hypothetical protein
MLGLWMGIVWIGLGRVLMLCRKRYRMAFEENIGLERERWKKR